MKSGNLFWGVLLITLGVLIGLRNFDIFYFSWSSLLQLWPLILVFWGISALPVNSGVKVALTFITIAIGIAILISNPRSDSFWLNWTDRARIEKEIEEQPWVQQGLSEDYQETITHAVLRLDAAAGHYIVEGATSMLYEFETEGNTGPFEASTQNPDENTAIVRLSQKKFRTRGSFKNTVVMKLNDNPTWNFKINAGAAKMDLDLTPFIAEKIDIGGGASAIELTIGERSKQTEIEIKAGVSSITIKVPENSACEVRTKTVLSGKEMAGFNQIESGLYQTPNFTDSANQIQIRVDAAVSELIIERY